MDQAQEGAMLEECTDDDDVSSEAEENVTCVCSDKASSLETDVSDHRAAIHNDISPGHKAIKNHNCETCHHVLISKR